VAVDVLVGTTAVVHEEVMVFVGIDVKVCVFVKDCVNVTLLVNDCVEVSSLTDSVSVRV
jgi:hypothetical protein